MIDFNKRNSLLMCALMLFSISVCAQKKMMTPETYGDWNSIINRSITEDGQYIHYGTKKELGDQTLYVYEVTSGKSFSFERYKQVQFSTDGQWVCFTTGLAYDSLRQLKLNHVEMKDFPKDTLNIFHLEDRNLLKIPEVNSFAMPTDWTKTIHYYTSYEISEKDTAGQVSTKNREVSIFRDLATMQEDTIDRVEQIIWAKDGLYGAYSRSGKDTLKNYGVFYRDFEKSQETQVEEGQGDYYGLSLSKDGSKLAYIADQGEEQGVDRPYTLFLYEKNKGSAKAILNKSTRVFKEDVYLNIFKNTKFSDDGRRLFFGLSQKERIKDTLILEEERAVVEVWSSSDKKLYTQQKVEINVSKTASQTALYDLEQQNIRPLESSEIHKVSIGQKENARYGLGYNDRIYNKESSWTGRRKIDMYLLDLETGDEYLLAKEIDAFPRMSPDAKFIYYYHRPDSSYYLVNTDNRQISRASTPENVHTYDEQNDRPIMAGSYGVAGWTEKDANFLIYDRYDIWSIDPKNIDKPKRITRGREQRVVYRYMNLDPEIPSIRETFYVHFFNENTKTSGYAKVDLLSGEVKELLGGDYVYPYRILKAKNSDRVIYTRENFQIYPDIWTSDISFENPKRVSDVNPQQKDYKWGTGQLVEWTTFKGNKLQGMLFKPMDFDPKKKYPMIVNFYERSSNSLKVHREPLAHRSSINYSYYVNHGYIIFNPDIVYTVGDPGESAYDAVVSGVEALVKEGYVDERRIGLQGHSWAGYQIAYLLGKTDIFACAEAGAPVVNMTSAYGGIRWGSGLSRMFQYEQTQSRLGDDLWSNRDVYIRNSPIFEVDKVTTPVLILHNDQDGAVPWTQGIEYFVALRRLDKKAWMLNYNDEPHWPLKYPNRLDFQTRMEQFFDYYLKDGIEPSWMKQGIPAVDKEFNLGY